MTAAELGETAVVGAGPAGAYLAWQLARAGVPVDIYDDSHPREKPCGGVLSAETLAYTPDAATLPSANPLTKVAFQTPYGRRFQVSPPRRSVAVDRAEFDRWLLQKALDAGARHFDERVRGVDLADQRPRVHTRDRTVRYRRICGADGVLSIVAKAAGLRLSESQLGYTMGGWGPVVGDPGTVTVRFGDHIGYAWIINRAQRASIGIGGPMSQRERLQPEFSAFLAEQGIDAAQLKPFRWVIPFSDDPDHLERPRCGGTWLTVGDAAGFCDPLTGEGIFLAIASAHEAAAAIVQGDHLSYEARWRNRLGPNHYFGMRNRNLLASRPMAEHLLRMLRQNPDMGLSFFKLL